MVARMVNRGRFCFFRVFTASAVVIDRRPCKRPRAHPEPAGNDDQGESGIANGEYPCRRSKIQQGLQPMCDERAGIRDVASAFAESHLPGCQRTNESNPGLKCNNADRYQVCNSKPRISHPGPFTGFADQYQCQADDYKRHKHHMAEQ